MLWKMILRVNKKRQMKESVVNIKDSEDNATSAYSVTAESHNSLRYASSR